MAELLPPAVIRFLADTKELTAGISESEGKLGAMNKTLTTFGKASAAALVVAGAESVHMASNFQKTMMLTRTQAGDLTDNLGKMSQAVLKLAPEVGQGPEKLAEGLYHVTSVGYRGADAMNILKVAAEGAKVGNADLDSTTYALTSTMNAFAMKGAGGAQQMMAQLNAIVGSGDMKMQDLNDAIKNGIFATSQTFGVSIQSAGAALAFLTDRGQTAATASTQLTMAMTLMAAPTSKAAKLLGDIGMQGPEVKAHTDAMTQALRKAGLSTVTLADDLKKPNGISVALADLKTHLEKAGLSSEASAALMARAFGGGKTDKAIVSLIANLDALNKKYTDAGENAANYGQALADTQKTFSYRMDQLKASAEALGIKIGLSLIPPLLALAKFFSDHQNITEGVVIALGALMAISIGVWLGNLAATAAKTAVEFGKLAFEIGTTVVKAAGQAAVAVGRLAVTVGTTVVRAVAGAVVEVARFVGEMAIQTVQAAGDAAVAVGRFAVTVGTTVARAVAGAVVEVARFAGELVIQTVQAAGEAAMAIGRLTLTMSQQLVRAAMVAGRAILSFTASLMTNPVFLIVAAIVALVAIIVELWRHWDQVWGWVQHHKAYAALIAALVPITIPIFAIVAAGKYLQKHWSEIWDGIKSAFSAAWAGIKSGFDAFVHAIDWVSGKISGLLRDVGKVGSAVAHPLSTVGHVIGFASGGNPPVGRAVLVGEQGPELAVFGGPAYIHPAGATRSILSGGKASGGWVGDASSWGGGGSDGGGTTVIQPPDVVVQIDGQTLFRIVQAQALRNQRRNVNNGLQLI